MAGGGAPAGTLQHDPQYPSRHLSSASRRSFDIQQTFTFISTSPVKAFALFPKLPLEIRLMIYDLVIETPRVIEVSRSVWVDKRDNVKSIDIWVHAMIPSLVQVSKETRTVSRQKLEQPFLQSLGSPAYVNFKFDLLLFDMTIDELVTADKFGGRKEEDGLLQVLYPKLRYCVFDIPGKWSPKYFDGFKNLQLMVLSLSGGRVRRRHRGRRSRIPSSPSRGIMNRQIAMQKEAGEISKTLSVRFASLWFTRTRLLPGWVSGLSLHFCFCTDTLSQLCPTWRSWNSTAQNCSDSK